MGQLSWQYLFGDLNPVYIAPAHGLRVIGPGSEVRSGKPLSNLPLIATGVANRSTRSSAYVRFRSPCPIRLRKLFTRLRLTTYFPPCTFYS
jgi:hypothetical protein